MSTFDKLEKECYKGPLVKKAFGKDIKIQIKSLDVSTVNRINDKISFASNQNKFESQNAMNLADEIYSD